MMWLTGGALALAIFMIAGLLFVVTRFGLGTFWQGPLVQVETLKGELLIGEIAEVEPVPDEVDALRRLYRTGNFDLTNRHFVWLADADVATRTEPKWAVLLERLEWGRFHGIPEAFKIGGEVVAQGPAEAWAAFQQHHPEVRARWRQIQDIEDGAVAEINFGLNERGRLPLRRVGLRAGFESEEYREAEARFEEKRKQLELEYGEVRAEIDALAAINADYVLVMRAANGAVADIAVSDVVRAVVPNQLGFATRLGLYLSRTWEFLADTPRAANSEGGVFPAIFGTVMMTLVMTIFVVPFGVLAALYLREYAKQGAVVSTVRIAVNNLAGVPSIVFGVFGLGFFCYMVGGGLDVLFFPEYLPSPKFGTGGILWASLTLALLTLPVVIVATEEALAAVPNSMREGSYACGASKWQTIKRIVLPRALPGIMPGVVLAIARGAGEVAPLMLVGAVKLAPELPFDMHAPFVHLERSFMHLGFHIYDLGFQSQNSKAAEPMVFTTTLLLIGLIVTLDISAIGIRTRLRKRFGGGRI
jgi:phosphate transport system permease protein